MLSHELLKILVCPESKLSLSIVSSDVLQKIKQLKDSGSLKFINGEICTTDFESLLVRSDNKIAYMIKDDIPILLVDKGIRMEMNS